MAGKLVLYLSPLLVSMSVLAAQADQKDKSSAPQDSALTVRIEIERETRFQKFVLTPQAALPPCIDV